MAPVPRLLLITTPAMDLRRVRDVLPGLAGVVDAVLLRWPSTPARAVYEAARTLAAMRPRPALLASDRADLAWAAGLDGVHLKDGGIPAARLRSWPLAIVGASCHPSKPNAEPPPGADYVTASPVFATASKPGVEPVGLETLTRYCASAPVPVLALGGIDASRVADCRRAGAHGVAVLSAVWSREDAVGAARELRDALDAV